MAQKSVAKTRLEKKRTCCSKISVKLPDLVPEIHHTMIRATTGSNSVLLCAPVALQGGDTPSQGATFEAPGLPNKYVPENLDFRAGLQMIPDEPG